MNSRANTVVSPAVWLDGKPIDYRRERDVKLANFAPENVWPTRALALNLRPIIIF